MIFFCRFSKGFRKFQAYLTIYERREKVVFFIYDAIAKKVLQKDYFTYKTYFNILIILFKTY